MSSSQRVVALSVAFCIVATVAVAAIIIAANRPAVLVTAATTTSSTIGAGILTSGQASVSKKPDLAIVSAGVQSQAGTAVAAQTELAGKTNKLVTRIKSLGVPDKDLSTAGYWVGPVYAPAGQTITAYRASLQLVAKWHNVDTAGKAVDAICGAKQNQLNAASSSDAGAQHQSRSDLPLNIETVLHRIGNLQLRIEYLENVGPL